MKSKIIIKDYEIESCVTYLRRHFAQ